MHEFFQILPPPLPKSAPPQQKGPRSSFGWAGGRQLGVLLDPGWLPAWQAVRRMGALWSGGGPG